VDETTSQAKRYSQRKIRLAVIQLILTVVFLLIMVVSDASAMLRELVARWSHNFYVQVGLYLALFAGIYYVLFAGLDFYGGFVVEHKFSLSNQTVFGWLKKSAKKVILSLVMLLVAGEVLYFFLRHFPNYWWLLTATAWLLLTIVLGRITPILIIPLFYKCSVLPHESLRNRLLELGKKCGVTVKDVFEIQLSKDTKKANAAVAGIGKSRRILLGDTLLKNYAQEEVEAVFAHELGHVRLSHTWKILGFAAMISLICFYVTDLLVETGIARFGFDHIHDIAAFPLLALILMIAGLISMPIQNAYLRHLEKQADMFAIDHIPDNHSFISAIKKLSDQNLSDPSPSSLVELLLYDHPPIAKRLAYCERKDKSQARSTKAGK